MTVVVGYVPNEYGEAALAEGIVEAGRRGTGIVVVNASKGDSLVDEKYVSESDWTELQQRLVRVDVPHEVRQQVGPDVAEELLAVVEDTGAEALVIGMRRRTPVGKMLMGSVAQRVLLEAPCVVVAVKPR